MPSPDRLIDGLRTSLIFQSSSGPDGSRRRFRRVSALSFPSEVTVSAEETVQYQQASATDHTDICHVERWPMPICQVEIEKVGYGAVVKPVNGIAKRSSDDKRQTNNNKSVARPQQPNNQCRSNRSREKCERPRWQFMTTQHSEANATIPAEHQVKERRDAERLRGLHGIFEDPPLRCLIYEEPCQRQTKSEEPCPLCRRFSCMGRINRWGTHPMLPNAGKVSSMKIANMVR